MPGGGRIARLVLLVACMAAAPAPAASPDAAEVVDRIYERINALRSEAGLQPVQPDGELEAAASDFARYMARSGRYGHEADGRKPAERAGAHGYDYCIVSENIAYQYSSAGYTSPELAREFASGWAHSPPHRKNLLDPAVVDTGAAVAHSERDGRYYAVQMFGLPQSGMMRFEVSNRAGAPVRYRIGERDYRLAPRQTATHKRCRLDAVIFDWPGKQATARIEPADGARYAIERSAPGAWSVKRLP